MEVGSPAWWVCQPSLGAGQHLWWSQPWRCPFCRHFLRDQSSFQSLQNLVQVLFMFGSIAQVLVHQLCSHRLGEQERFWCFNWFWGGVVLASTKVGRWGVRGGTAGSEFLGEESHSQAPPGAWPWISPPPAELSIAHSPHYNATSLHTQHGLFVQGSLHFSLCFRALGRLSLFISSFSHMGCALYMNCSSVSRDQGMPSPDKLLIFQTCHWFALWPRVGSVHLHGCGRWDGDMDVLWELFQHLLRTVLGFSFPLMPLELCKALQNLLNWSSPVWRISAKYQFGSCFAECSIGTAAFIWLEFLMSFPGKTLKCSLSLPFPYLEVSSVGSKLYHCNSLFPGRDTGAAGRGSLVWPLTSLWSVMV